MSQSSEIILVLGGARSGKSRYAEELAETATGDRIYVATAEAGDAEMAGRISEHQARRGSSWTTREEPLDLSGLLEELMAPDTFVLVDCITLWLTNVLLAEQDCDQAMENLIARLEGAKGRIVLVSNEVGLGIVPENALARRFRNVAGLANQRLASVADRVVLVTAGIAMTLKPATDPTP